MARQPRETRIDLPREIASGVYCLETGKGLLRANVYLVRSGTSWALIDAASANCGSAIQKAAEALFGEGRMCRIPSPRAPDPQAHRSEHTPTRPAQPQGRSRIQDTGRTVKSGLQQRERSRFR
jgi:hypothetical protein